MTDTTPERDTSEDVFTEPALEDLPAEEPDGEFQDSGLDRTAFDSDDSDEDFDGFKDGGDDQ